ncbi:MAG: hypothetical protein ABIH39_06115 [Candidatus Margulisiibacteriota bacterium]
MNKKEVSITFTSFLYPRKRFLSGIARAIDFGGTFTSYNRSQSAKMADSLALYSDWKMVGHDLFESIDQYEDEYEKVGA